jgi:hypothetical protein
MPFAPGMCCALQLPVIPTGTRTMRNSGGSALACATIASGVLSILIAGVLSYMSNEYKLNYRSHLWAQAVHIAEAAVEVGFAELNNQYFKGGNGFQTARGWTDQGGGTYSKTISNVTDTAGKTIGELSITVTGVGTAHPQIFGTGTSINRAKANASRAIEVTTAPSPRFPVALMSKQRVDLNGNSVYTDSFDSSDPTKSSGGQYDPNKRQPNGHVASNDVLINTVNIGNADVYGTVVTGVGGTVAMGPNGSIGPTFDEANRATTVSDGVAKGWIRNDFDVDVPDASLPSGMDSAPSLGNINNATTINGGDWKIGNINLGGNGQTLRIEGTVRLYVTGNTSISGNGSILIAPGASLEVYSAGSVSIAGNGVANQTSLASNNKFFGLPGSTSWNISGNGQWTGTIYAPQADLAMKGGGTNGDMSGAVVAKSITLEGNVKFHYDEALEDSGGIVGYVIASWRSLSPNGAGGWVVE